MAGLATGVEEVIVDALRSLCDNAGAREYAFVGASSHMIVENPKPIDA
jgi:hypothetical protein